MNKLKKNQVIKNYKELCEIMDWKVSVGNSKKAQLKELEKYCKYYMEGQKFIIDKVYRTPKIQTSNSEYIQDIQNIILHEIVKNKYENLIITSKTLYKICNMINDNYNSNKNNISKQFNTNIGIIFDVYMMVNGINLNAIFRALRGLQNQSLILFEKKLYCVKETDTFKDRPTELDTFTKTEIVKMQKKLLDKYGFKKLTSLYYCVTKEKKDTAKKFTEEFTEYLSREFGFLDVFYAWDICYTKEGVVKELTQRELQHIRTNINKETLNKVKTRIDTNTANSKEFISEEVKELIDNGTYGMEELEDKNIITYYDKVRMDKDYNKNANNVATTIISNKTKINID